MVRKDEEKIMGFWESAARAGSYIANDMAKTAHRSSKNTEKFTAEQREAYSRMEAGLRTASEKADAYANRKRDDYNW